MLAVMLLSCVSFCLPLILYAILWVYGSVSALYSLFRSRGLVSEHTCFACTLFHKVARHHPLFPENLPGDMLFMRRVLKAYGLHLV